MIYLDNAATSFPKPASVVRAVRHAIEEIGGNPGRGGHKMAIAAAEEVYRARIKVAEMLRISDEEKIVFVPNATFGLNLSIYTHMCEGCHVLLSDMEHNAVFRPIRRLAAEGRITYSVYHGGDGIAEELTRLRRKNTRLLLCNAVSNVTGRHARLKDVIAWARENDVRLIVDGSQMIGHEPLPKELSEIDCFCAPGHKGLFGIQGGGFVYLRMAEEYPPFLCGGSGVDSRAESMPNHLPERYEAGTLSVPAIASLSAGIDFIKTIGEEYIRESEGYLSQRCAEMISDINGICIKAEDDFQGGVLSFTHRMLSPDFIAERLDRDGICVRAGLHCAPLAHRRIGTESAGGTVRVSFSVFSTENDIEAFYRSLRRIAESVK